MVYCTLHAQTHCKTQKTMKWVVCALTQAVSHHLHCAEARVRSQAGTCRICGGQSNYVTRFYGNMSVSPVSIIPPVLDTHSYIYHRHNVTFTTDSVVK